MAALELYFLGPLEIRSSGRQLSNPPTLKSQSLLAYLVCQRSHPQPRDRLAGLFYGEKPERKARRCLSTALWHIRRCFADETVLLNDSQTVQFDPQRNFWLDLDAFEGHAARTNLADLQAAAALYRGDFLDGFYDDWIISERYRLESIFLEVMARLMILHEAGGDFQTALATALRLLGRDSLNEAAHRLAMRAYCHLGQRKAALEQYNRCRQILLDELDAQPTGETTSLYQAILAGQFAIGSPPEISPIALRLPTQVGRSPLDITAPSRLVGREQEMAFLENCWERAQAGKGSLALIGGEVGVGKTRLVEEFANRIRWQGSRVLWGRCYEFERASPYQPVAEALRNFLPTLSQSELAGMPAGTLKEISRLAPEVLEGPAADEPPPLQRLKTSEDHAAELALVLDPNQAQLFDAVTRVLAEVSAQGALLVVLEDLHWASESTLQLLHHLSRRLSASAVFFVGTFRPEDIAQPHPLLDLIRQLAHDGIAWELDLSRLSQASVTTILEELSGAGEAVQPLAARLYQETEGNPFFLMESVKALFETGMIQFKEGVWQGDFALLSEMTPTLTVNLGEAVLARVRRLRGSARTALDLAAVLGREFDFEPFNLAWGKDEEDTLEALDELLRHRLIEEKSGPGQRDFAFTHHKIQEVVYHALPRHRRCLLHARAGTTLETLQAAGLETGVGELAYHFEQACGQDQALCGTAVHYLLQAGQQAVRGSANQEAVSYYQRGLAVLNSLPDTEKRMQREIELQIALAVPITSIWGYASPEVRGIFDRAYELCQKLGDTPDLFTSLVGLVRYYGVSGNHEVGVKLVEQLLAAAQASQEKELLIEAYRQMGGILFSLGKITEAQKYLAGGIALYDPNQHARLANRFGHDPAVTCLGYLSMTLWLLGYLDQARMQGQNLSQLTARMTQPSSRAYAFCHLAKQACMLGEVQAVSEHAGAAIQIARLHGLESWLALASALQGWALCRQGLTADGQELLNDGIAAWRSRGLTHWTPFLLSLQAEACLQTQDFQIGLRAITTALEIGQSRGDLYWLAELYRLQGELLWAGGEDQGSVAAHFQQAIEIARQQGARMLELRAATSLVRLGQEQGKIQAGQQALAEVYGWFTEGFDNPDLACANHLLQELSAPPGSYETSLKPG